MSRIYQPSSSVGNASLITISMWVRISRSAINAEGDIRVIEFGGPNDEEHLSSYVNVGIDSSESGYVTFGFISELATVDSGPTGDIVDVSGGGGFYDPSPSGPSWFNTNYQPIPQCGGSFPYWYLPSWGNHGTADAPHYIGVPPGFPASFPANTPINVRYIIEGSCAGFQFDAWNHIVISVDGAASQATTQTDFKVNVNSTAFMYMMVNGVDYTHADLFNAQDVDGQSPPTYNVRGSVLPKLFLPASESIDGLHGVSSSVQWNMRPREDDSPKVKIVGALNFQISGTEVGLPSQTTSDATSQIVDMADVQIWMGQCLDPGVASNFSKLILVDGSKSYPQPPSVAAAAFGQQTFLFTGTMPDFYNNGGTGGSFAYDGSIDPLEGPSY